MTSSKRIKIDEEKCIGCGLCANACPQSAIEMIDGKAKLTGELQCDGLGVCMGECPVGALEIVDRPVEETPAAEDTACPVFAPKAGGCPGSAERTMRGSAESGASGRSALTHWPVQLHLVNTVGKAFQNADVLIAADCTAFAMGRFHDTLLRGRAVVTACPKLDDTGPYKEKLLRMFREAKPRSITVARMEVPCCGGLVALVREALEESGVEIPAREVVVGIEGDLVGESPLEVSQRAGA